MGHLEAAVAFHRPFSDNQDNPPVQAQVRSGSDPHSSVEAVQIQFSQANLRPHQNNQLRPSSVVRGIAKQGTE